MIMRTLFASILAYTGLQNFRFSLLQRSWEASSGPVSYPASASPTCLRPEADINNKSLIVEQPSTRRSWNLALFSLPPPPEAAVSTAGTYKFKYRTYSNYEEVWACCSARYTLHPLFFKQTTPGYITIYDDGKAVNVEAFRLLSFLHATVVWDGFLNGGMIEWTDTRMIVKTPFYLLRSFWRFLTRQSAIGKPAGKVVKKPKAAEKVRNDKKWSPPWITR